MKSVIKSNVEYLKSKDGRDIAVWIYDMPKEKKKKKKLEDNTEEFSVEKQVFAISLIKDCIVGISTPLFKEKDLNETKEKLLNNINSIVEKEEEIDVERLENQLNE